MASSERGACSNHPMRPARAVCSLCNTRLCNECHRFRVGDRPACAACAYTTSTRSRRRISLAVSFAGLSVAGAIVAHRKLDLWTKHPEYVVVYAVVAAALTIWLAMTAREEGPAVTPREEDDAEDDPHAFDGTRSPYRGRIRRAVARAAPHVSGATTAVILAAAFATSAVLLPFGLHLPAWIEAEIVLAVWWTVMTVVLSVLLFRGYRLRDDWAFFSPWNRPTAADDTAKESPKARSVSSGCDGLDGCGLDGCSGFDGEGALIVIVVGAAAALVLGAAWILVEVAMPLTFFLIYATVMRAIGRVARTEGCEGDLGRSIGRGLLWSTVYLLPLVALTFLVHQSRH